MTECLPFHVLFLLRIFLCISPATALVVTKTVGENCSLSCVTEGTVVSLRLKKSEDCFLIYRSGRIEKTDHQCFKNRVRLDTTRGYLNVILEDLRPEDKGRYECDALVTTGENKKQSVMCYIDLKVMNISVKEKQTQDNDKGQDPSQGLDVVKVEVGVEVEVWVWEWVWVGVGVLLFVLLICAALIFWKRYINQRQQICKQPNRESTSNSVSPEKALLACPPPTAVTLSWWRGLCVQDLELGQVTVPDQEQQVLSKKVKYYNI
ncbi:unnamed protein product [Knipowitschia caucasica]